MGISGAHASETRSAHARGRHLTVLEDVDEQQLSCTCDLCVPPLGVFRARAESSVLQLGGCVLE